MAHALQHRVARRHETVAVARERRAERLPPDSKSCGIDWAERGAEGGAIEKVGEGRADEDPRVAVAVLVPEVTAVENAGDLYDRVTVAM